MNGNDHVTFDTDKFANAYNNGTTWYPFAEVFGEEKVTLETKSFTHSPPCGFRALGDLAVDDPDYVGAQGPIATNCWTCGGICETFDLTSNSCLTFAEAGSFEPDPSTANGGSFDSVHGNSNSYEMIDRYESTFEANGKLHADELRFAVHKCIEESADGNCSCASSETARYPCGHMTGHISTWSFNGFNNGYGSGDISRLFAGLKSFNQDISGWSMSGAVNMDSMFSGAVSFNQNLNSWDVSMVTKMKMLFQGSSAFNGDISSWQVSQVTDMSYMLSGASSFNQDLSSWDTSRVVSMSSMFRSASSFNLDVSSWDVSTVTSTSQMFLGALVFNQPIGGWDTSQVTSMKSMFSAASAFDRDLSTWDTSRVTNMDSTFSGASAFNQDLSNWDVSQVTNMQGTFSGACSFNQDLSSWDTSKVTSMGSMFAGASSFNQDLSSWDVQVRNGDLWRSP